MVVYDSDSDSDECVQLGIVDSDTRCCANSVSVSYEDQLRVCTPFTSGDMPIDPDLCLSNGSQWVPILDSDVCASAVESTPLCCRDPDATLDISSCVVMDEDIPLALLRASCR